MNSAILHDSVPQSAIAPLAVSPFDVDELRKTSSVAAILVLLFSGFLAVILVPDDVQPLGALRLSAVVLAVGLLCPAVREGWRNPKLLLRPQHVLAAAPVLWLLLDPIQGSYAMEGFAPLQIRTTLAAITVFSAAAWVPALRPSTWLVDHLPKTVFREFAPTSYFVLGLVAFALAFLRFAIPAQFDLPVMVNALFEDRWSAPWSRGEVGGLDAVLDHLAYFGYVLPLLTVLLARRVGWFHFRTLIIGLCAVIITLFIAQGGARRIVGVLLGSALAFWFLGLPRIRFSSMVVVLLVIIGIGASLDWVLEVRGTGVAAAATIEKSLESEEEDLALIKVDDNFRRFAQITAIFPDYNAYTTWRYPLYVFARPVPRVVWPNKPTDPGFDLAEFLGLKGVSLSCSVIGELFMCGGFIAVALGGLLYGRVAALLSPLWARRYGSSGLLLYSAGLLMLLAGVRSMIELILMSYMLLAWIVLCHFHGAVEG